MSFLAGSSTLSLLAAAAATAASIVVAAAPRLPLSAALTAEPRTSSKLRLAHRLQAQRGCLHRRNPVRQPDFANFE